MTTSYDKVPYPSHAFPETHPDRLAVAAALTGHRAPAVESCRVLEIGCGDGSNLIPMKIALPNMQILGIDLAEQPVNAGREIVERLALPGIELRAMDLMDFSASEGEFDYILAHGFCSWVPDEVLHQFFTVCERHLSPGGVVYASYNTHPQGHLRQISREMMRFHVEHAKTQSPVAEGRKLMDDVRSAATGELWKSILDSERKRLNERPENTMFHDDLSPFHRPFYLWEFVELAAAHGLQYLGDSRLGELTARHEQAYPGTDLIRALQYADFAAFQGFRRTLLCRKDVGLDREHAAQRLQSLLIASPLRQAAQKPDGAVSFRNDRGSGNIETNDAALTGVLRQLEEVWPQAVPLSELTRTWEPDAKSNLAGQLMRLEEAQLIDLRSVRLPVANKPPKQPVASPLARLEAMRGPRLTTLLHTHVEMAEDPPRRFLMQLDGARDKHDLAKALMAQWPGMPRPQADTIVHDTLTRFSRMGLLLDP